MKRRLLAAALACAIAAAGAVLAAQPASADSPVSATALASLEFTDLVVDETHARIFISMQDPAAVVVADFEGVLLETIAGFTAPQDLSISPDDGTVYATEQDSPSIAMIDTQSHVVSRLDLPAGQCPTASAEAAGKLWYAYLDCSSTTGGLASYDPITGAFTTGDTDFVPAELRVLPSRPDRLFAMGSGAARVYDVSGGILNEVAAGDVGADCVDAALLSGGDAVVMACGETGAPVRATNDFSPGEPFPSQSHARAVATSLDGRFTAVGSADAILGRTTISIRDSVTRAETNIVQYSSPSMNISAGSLALTGDRRLVVIVKRSGVQYLYIRRAATVYGTSVSVTATPGANDSVDVSGRLNRGPGAGTILAVTRTDSAGTHELAPVTTDAEGLYAFNDSPGVSGRVSYRVTFAGDVDYAFATNITGVVLRGMSGDVNGDGYAETVVGAPGEDIGDDSDTGQFHLLYGKPPGVSTIGNKAFHQDTEGVPGSNEDGDRFGAANVFGDFNGDGYADLVVSAPGENIGSTVDVGEVFVFYGTPTGLYASGAQGLYPAEHSSGMLFGTSLAAGDFNGDKRDDLAVGAPGADMVQIYPGTEYGLVHLPYSVPSGDDRFGSSLDIGDVNGDGHDDLAVGAAGGSGSVALFHGTASGLERKQNYHKDFPGVPGSPGASDSFGAAVALADFNGDGKDDLAVGAPGSAVTGTDGERKAGAGTVTVLYSRSGQIDTFGAVQLTQKSAGIPGNPGANDRWGATIAAGDADNDGRDELAVYGAGEDFITVIPGGAAGLVPGGAKAWSQDSPGVPGGSEAGDRWGASLRFADTNGTGRLSLIVGAPGEDSGAGAFTVLYGGAAGVTGTGAKFFSQDTEGIPGGEEKNDGFGSFS